MFYGKSLTVACVLFLLVSVSGVEGKAAPPDVRGQARSGAKSRRAASKKKKVTHTTNRATAGVAEGTWGGEHIRLVVTGGGASVEYDCAHGTIDAPLAPDAEGRFDLRGTHVRERPGPIRVGFTPPPRPARYTGSIKGRTMTLTVTLADENSPLGTFTLTRGSEGRVRKCR